MFYKSWPHQALLDKGVPQIPGSQHVSGYKEWCGLLTCYDTHLTHILEVRESRAEGAFSMWLAVETGSPSEGTPHPLTALPYQECTLKVQDGKFKLQDLLVVPMQRVLKYHLLLKVRPSGCSLCPVSHGPGGMGFGP